MRAGNKCVDLAPKKPRLQGHTVVLLLKEYLLPRLLNGLDDWNSSPRGSGLYRERYVFGGFRGVVLIGL